MGDENGCECDCEDSEDSSSSGKPEDNTTLCKCGEATLEIHHYSSKCEVCDKQNIPIFWCEPCKRNTCLDCVKLDEIQKDTILDADLEELLQESPETRPTFTLSPRLFKHLFLVLNNQFLAQINSFWESAQDFKSVAGFEELYATASLPVGNCRKCNSTKINLKSGKEDAPFKCADCDSDWQVIQNYNTFQKCESCLKDPENPKCDRQGKKGKRICSVCREECTECKANEDRKCEKCNNEGFVHVHQLPVWTGDFFISKQVPIVLQYLKFKLAEYESYKEKPLPKSKKTSDKRRRLAYQVSAGFHRRISPVLDALMAETEEAKRR